MLNPRDGFAVRVPFCLMHWLCNVFYVVCMCRCADLWSYVRLSLSIPYVCYLENYLLPLNNESAYVLIYYEKAMLRSNIGYMFCVRYL